MASNANKLIKDVDAQVEPVASGIKGTTDAARAAFKQAEKTLRFDEGVPGQIASSIKETLSAAQDTLKETTQNRRKYQRDRRAECKSRI